MLMNLECGNKLTYKLGSLLALFLFLAQSLYANDPQPQQPPEHASPSVVKEEQSVTKQTFTINGNAAKYLITAGNYLIKDEHGKESASIFFIAYTKENVDPATRPITFCFNGGPGSSSVWLHIGAFGPKRLVMNDDGFPILPPRLEPNANSILDVTDLVFIDPVSTGYSKAIPEEDSKKFHSVSKDVASVGEFIRLYVTRNNRWLSPKFLAGESYGTTRAAALALYLHANFRMYVNGIIMISSILNFQPYFPNGGNDLPYAMSLPSYAATAWYHKKLGPEYQGWDLPRVLKEAENYASGDYLIALQKGDALTPEEQQKVINKLSSLTGLSKEYLERYHLRVPIHRFSKALLRDENRTIGRFDGRFKGIDADEEGECCTWDPTYSILFGPFTSAFNAYLKTDLKVDRDEEYEILASLPNWDYSDTASNQYLNVADSLKEVMSKDPHLKVFVASGYYDMATPYYAGVYTLNHMKLDPSLRKNIQNNFYPAGHMMFVQKASLVQLKKDLAQFIEQASRS
jgi:carboxypeptidase C (cathepsin A)